ncbi:metal ABC transporter ATP-binding protein [Vagococcus elongatus]|uniref:Manganese ABC transporter ATP-binding protein n=1 Tax=Vagococcus elongatus TaxID=180344 RepID=A0A430AMR6_9ENTE|nr:metal ABC transporter ATP-binding protein [Vagococcus elongatus]RSU09450.1 manganese ABC transporter ATP-binding protein [Vagococcus elongatus]
MIEVKDLDVSYFGNNVFNNLNVSIPLHQSTGIIGPNGAGKSTLLKAMLSVVAKSHGEVLIDGESIGKFQKKIAYVPQRSDVDLTFPITVYETVLTGTFPTLSFFKRPGEKEKQMSLECLKKLSLEDLADRQIDALSGGQLQRVFIARALAQQADFLFLDEPFAGIDMLSERLIHEVLDELVKNGKTILTVHHDLNKVKNYFDYLLIVNKRIVSAGETEKTFNIKNIQKAYGQQFGDVLFSKEGDHGVAV